MSARGVPRWCAWEDEILASVYPDGGYKAVQKRLPHRKPQAILRRAARNRVRANSQFSHPAESRVYSVERIKQHPANAWRYAVNHESPLAWRVRA